MAAHISVSISEPRGAARLGQSDGNSPTVTQSSPHHPQMITRMLSTTINSIQGTYPPYTGGKATHRHEQREQANRGTYNNQTHHKQRSDNGAHTCVGLGTRRALGAHHVKLACFERELQLCWRFTNSMTQIIGTRTDCEWTCWGSGDDRRHICIIINTSHVLVMQRPG